MSARPEFPPPVPGEGPTGKAPDVFVFNPFAEAYISQGTALTPVSHQAMLARDLANLPQFLCKPDDIVLVAKRPSAGFLGALFRVGFQSPEFVELRDGRIDPADTLLERKLGTLRPWAWGPDSVKLLEPLFPLAAHEALVPSRCFNDAIARLYSKTWSADLLRKILARCGGSGGRGEPWLCSEQEAGIAVDTPEDALKVIAAIRSRGHQRIVAKEAYGLAGQNSIRLWEPEVLPAQRQWLAHRLRVGGQVVVEPWLERVLDFSVQLEMGQGGLIVCGYTGLVNDLKGQFVANWAEADYHRAFPAKVAALFGGRSDLPGRFQRLYGEIFSLLEAELRRAGFAGPVNIDAFVYRGPQGGSRLKPVVEINPRYTMGRLTVELMKHVCVGSCGLFRLVTAAQARAQGFADLSSYGSFLCQSHSLRLEGDLLPMIRQGAVCLNDPGQAEVCLAIFQVTPTADFSRCLHGKASQRAHRA